MKLSTKAGVSRRIFLIFLVAVALGVGLTACGSSGSSSTAADAAATTGSSSQATARLNLAKCFRAHGINVPDPSSGGGAAGGGGLFRVLRNYSQAQITAARQACSQYFAQAFPRANISPQQRAQLQQQLVKFAQCMRSHGVNVPDPTFNNNGGTGPGAGFGFRGGFGSAQRNSPAFQAAAKACQSLRPQFGRGGLGGAGGAGGPGAAGATGSGTTGA